VTSSPERRRRATARDRGQATIEFMAMVPLVLAALVFALQVMVLAYTAHGASQAARDGARAYSLNESPVAAVQASLPGAISLVNVSTFGPDHGVRVTVEAPAMLFITDRQITRSVTMP
jgi:Flp pilus assembly protein TadG